MYELSMLDDDSEGEMFESILIIATRRKRVIRARPNHFNLFDDADFYARFRMSKTSAYNILLLIGPHIKHTTTWNNALSEEQMFLITLRLYATGGMLRTIGDLYGVSESTVSRVVTKVSEHIALLRAMFINLPVSNEDRKKMHKDFYNIAKFPNTIAALDCTHVKIISPGGVDAELYRNRKGFFSVNVQTMCDANLKITNIVARWPGSAHDSNIFKHSQIFARFENGEFGDSLIVADSGYANTKYMVTPLLNPRSPEENLYNESQIRTRCCVERSYGVWKRRFPILSLGNRLNNRKVQSIVVATAVLHNICCINNELDLPNLPHDVAEAVDLALSVPNNRTTDRCSTNDSTRSALINQYFKNLL